MACPSCLAITKGLLPVTLIHAITPVILQCPFARYAPPSAPNKKGNIIRNEPRPRQHTDALCLAFINTTDNHDGIPSRDELQPGYANLLAWCVAAEAIDEPEAKWLLRAARKAPREASDIRRRAISLRRALRAIFRSIIAGGRPEQDALALLEREIRSTYAPARLSVVDGMATWHWPEKRDLEHVLWPVVRSTEELLFSDRTDRIRECAGEGCQNIFLDTSKNRSRRFCSPGGCGNRERVRRFRHNATTS